MLRKLEYVRNQVQDKLSITWAKPMDDLEAKVFCALVGHLLLEPNCVEAYVIQLLAMRHEDPYEYEPLQQRGPTCESHTTAPIAVGHFTLYRHQADSTRVPHP